MWISDWFRIRRLNREADRVHRHYAPEIAALKAEGKDIGANQTSYQAYQEARIHLDEMEIYTRRLVRQARKYLLPIPPKNKDSDHWHRSRVLGTWSLTEEGYYQLRKAIREEQKHNHEVRVSYAGMVLGALGIIASIGAVGVDAWLKIFGLAQN